MPQTTDAPLLSILIPAYRYAEGVQRILSRLGPVPSDVCEIMVFDDSPDDDVAAAVERWCGESGVPVVYRHHRPSLGAAGNWNSLVQAACGNYCLLLHHDEFPLGDAFVERLLAALRAHRDMDILLLDCVLVEPTSGKGRRHLPMWFRKAVMTRAPYYLFRRNVIGPTSTLVVRREHYPRFDPALRWLVDVEAYAWLLLRTRRVQACPSLRVGSLLGRSDSITAGLGPTLRDVERAEKAALRTAHRRAGLWLGPAQGERKFNRSLLAIESAGWVAMRLLTRAWALLSPIRG